jgi:hypothetical protein
MMTFEAYTEKPDEVHPHVAGLVNVKALGKSHPIILRASTSRTERQNPAISA